MPSTPATDSLEAFLEQRPDMEREEYLLKTLRDVEGWIEVARTMDKPRFTLDRAIDAIRHYPKEEAA